MTIVFFEHNSQNNKWMTANMELCRATPSYALKILASVGLRIIAF